MSKVGQWLKAKKNLIFAVAGIAVLTAGMSLALFTDSESAANTVKTGQVQIEAGEDLEGLAKKNIFVIGKGASPCYVRMRVDVPVLKYTDNGTEKTLTPKVSYNQRTAESENTQDDGKSVSAEGSDWNSFSAGKKIRPGSESSPSIQSAEWVKKDDGYWYLSRPLKNDEKAVLCNSVKYENIKDSNTGKLELPSGISKDQLSIVVYAEAVQSDNIDVGDKEDADAAYEAFQQLQSPENQD